MLIVAEELPRFSLLAAFFGGVFRRSRADTTREMSAIADEVQLLTPAQAAAALAVSRRQLDRLVDAGVLKPVRLLPNGNRS